MTEINKDLIFKNWSKILVVILAFLLLLQCNNSSEAIAEAKFQKKEAEKHLANAELFQQKNEALIEKESKYLDNIANLESKNNDVQKQIVIVKEKGKVEIERIKKFKSSEIAKYIQDRYKTDQNNVTTTSNGTIISDTIAKKMIVEVTEGDICNEEVFGLNEIIYNDKEIFKQKDGIISNVKEQNVNLLSAIEEYKKADELKSNALENTEKAFKKERNKKNIYKITTVLAVLGGGYLLIK